MPYGTTDYHATFTPDDTSLKEALWSVTEPDGSPTDKATISRGGGTLTVNRLSGKVRITATAADSGRVMASKIVDLDLDVSLMRANAAMWPGVTAKASSEFPGYPAVRVFDGFGTQTSGDWASKGEQNPWIELSWPQEIRADKVTLYDRTSIDDAHGGTLIFPDGSTVDVSGLPTDGSPKTVTFPMKTFDHVRFQVKGGTGPNVGLLEFQVYAVPLTPQAPYRVSVERRAGGTATVSWTPPRFDGGAPVTGYAVRTYRGGTLVDEKTTDADTRQLTVPAQDGDEFKVAATNVIGTGPERGLPVFATAIAVDGPDSIADINGTAHYTATFTPQDTTYKDVTWTVTEPNGDPTEKAVIDKDGVLTVNHRPGQVLVTATNADGGPEVSGSKLVTIAIDPDSVREDLALRSGVVATASSEFSSAYNVDRVHDGFGAGSGDWASKGESNPWVQLDWPQPIQSDRIKLYDRTDAADEANGGTLTFSDGSTVDVSGIPGNGDPKTVDFPTKTFQWVRFQVKGGTGPNVGLLEFEVDGPPDAG